MKSLKIIFFSLLAIIAIVLVAAAFLPDNITITSNIIINTKPEKVYDNVVYLKKWKNWSPFEHDSTMSSKFSGPEAGVGSTREWSGEVIGAGKMTTVAANGSHIKNRYDFGKKGGATGDWTFTTLDATKTKVIWSTHITGLKYPVERILGIFLNPLMKPMFDNGLKDLKEYTETGKITDKEINNSSKNE